VSGRKLSPEFLAHISQAVPVGRDKRGRLKQSSRSAKAEKWARGVLFGKERPNDSDYIKSLRARLKNGVAGSQEIQLWRMIFGDPPKADVGRNEDAAHFEEVRRDLFEFLLSAPAEARELSARLTRPRLLPGPKPVEPEKPPEPPEITELLERLLPKREEEAG